MDNIQTGQLAALLDLTTARISQLTRMGVLERIRRGVYDLEASVKGYVTYLRQGDDDGLSPAQERAKLHKVQRERIEMEMQKSKGELIETDSALKSYADATEIAKRHLFVIPHSLAPYLVNKDEAEIASQLYDAIHHALTNVSELEATDAD